MLGKHNLGCSEKVQLDRFTDRFNNRYDGLHMNSKEGKLRPRPGPDSSCDQKNFPQAKPMSTPQTESVSQSCPVPVQNRFTVLGN